MAQVDDYWSDEQQEWLDAIDDVLRHRGEAHAKELVRRLHTHLSRQGAVFTEATLNTPYKNTIALTDQPAYPGDIGLELRIENIMRWNAAAMVQQAFDSGADVGGHIATYFSAATMMEVGFNHVFRCSSDLYGGDQVHFQAHTAPGVYARAFLEGRLSRTQLANFRRELADGGGLPSYPHPRRLPSFWQMPTASMGLSAPSAIYQARFAKYLEHRGLKPDNGGKIWTFIGDGEADEPEVLGTINVASREELDNLVFVVNCNLQRLDGPVRGNGKIIQELERSFRGADWHVIKVIWGEGWDPLFARDSNGVLQARMEQAVDGDYQMYTVSPGDFVREHWVENTPDLRELMKTLTDEEIRSIKRGGQDHKKVYAAFAQAAAVTGKPCVILMKTVKGDGLGRGTAGSNTVHQKKVLNEEERRALAKRLNIPLNDQQVAAAEFYKPREDSDEHRYIVAQRERLGGFLPRRSTVQPTLGPPELDLFADQLQGSERPQSTTMVLVRMLSRLLRDKSIGRYVVPIVPDEARTFGMDGLFPQAGIYSPAGQNYRPVDAETIAPYKESATGQILQEGICETGAMASFLAAGTAYANYGLPMIPFYIFYSIFGLQRVGDMVWACGDSMAKGFLLGGTSGRTTLNGEGVQHQDGHSHILASTVPNLLSYDPAFGFEVAVLVRDGIRRMYQAGEDVFYYITVTNQPYRMPAMPDGVTQGIVKGIYAFDHSADAKVNLLGSGAVMYEVIEAAALLREIGVSTSVWSVTSYTELARDAIRCERANLHRAGAGDAASDNTAATDGSRGTDEPTDDRTPYLERVLANEPGIVVAASDYMKALPLGVAPWIRRPFTVLGTDGFGLSESRADLRDYFEVSARWIAYAALATLAQAGEANATLAQRFAREHELELGRTRDHG